MQERHGLLEVDDVDVVADAEEIRLHLRVPAAGVMAEMHAGFEKLAHGEIGQSHEKRTFLFRLSRRGGTSLSRHRSVRPPAGGLPRFCEDRY